MQSVSVDLFSAFVLHELFHNSLYMYLCAFLCVCVCASLCVRVCVCACVDVREAGLVCFSAQRTIRILRTCVSVRERKRE